MPKISVIVPVYKVEKYIHRCVDSILNQTFTDFELILVDDGSPDNCGKICDEYAEKDNRIHVIHKENGGLSDARNVGIDWAFEHSDSEWITFIDSDDWIHPRYLELLYNAVVETNSAICICGYEETTGKETTVDENIFKAEIINTEFFYSEHIVNAVVAWGKLYKKDLFREIRYPVGKLHEDEFTTYKVLFQYNSIAYVSQPLYFYFINSEGITKSEWSPKRLDALDAYEEQLLFFSANNYKKAFEVVANAYAKWLLRFINDSENHLSVKDRKKLRHKLRLHLHRCHRELGWNYKNKSWYYESAYSLYSCVLKLYNTMLNKK